MLYDNVQATDAHRPRRHFRQLDCRRNPSSWDIMLVSVPNGYRPPMLRGTVIVSWILSRRDLQDVPLVSADSSADTRL